MLVHQWGRQCQRGDVDRVALAGLVVRGAAQAQKLRIIANTLRLALPTIGRPWPTQPISKSSWACLRTAATASAVLRLKGPRMGAESAEAIESPVNSTPRSGSNTAMLPRV